MDVFTTPATRPPISTFGNISRNPFPILTPFTSTSGSGPSPSCQSLDTSNTLHYKQQQPIDNKNNESVYAYTRSLEVNTCPRKPDLSTKYLDKFYSGEEDRFQLASSSVSLPFTCQFNNTPTPTPLLVVGYESGSVVILDSSRQGSN